MSARASHERAPGAADGPSDAFPSRPIDLIVPFPAGGVVDLMGRGLAEAVAGHLPVTVRVVNRPGANGTAGITEVLAAAPDGYTLGLCAVAILTVQPHLMALPYRSPRDCAPVIGVASLPTVLCSRADAGWQSATDFVAAARAAPGALTVGVPGIGRISHLNLEYLTRLAGIDCAVVPFDGPQQIAALLDGRVDAAVANVNPVLEHVHGGTVRVLAVFQADRTSLLPEVPTTAELGYDEGYGLYHFVVAPRAVPRSILGALFEACREALAEPAFATLAERSGFTIEPRAPATLARDLEGLYHRYGELVARLGLHVAR